MWFTFFVNNEYKVENEINQRNCTICIDPTFKKTGKYSKPNGLIKNPNEGPWERYELILKRLESRSTIKFGIEIKRAKKISTYQNWKHRQGNNDPR